MDLHEISGKVGNGPVNKRLNFGGDRIRIATLVRRALAEVCTVPVLLVLECFFLKTYIYTGPFHAMTLNTNLQLTAMTQLINK